ncbi:MAG: DNA mismatch repair endonuclease MutL, partial [Desulfobulbaceae bacterium]|nr:DNA mismatch repair endonuclease MutL [Desulfobulbaceae bacterium]HIJ79871.1 DNA mismatch repair protein MutL [Deltaproteobacteria bacterium]
LVPPDAEVAASARLRTFVNGRMVRDRMITHGVGEGLHNYLMKGHRPVGVFFISVPPETVDVNVHPTKQEVRFHNSRLVHDAIAAAVSQAMAAYQQRLKGEIFTPASVKKDIMPLAPSAYPVDDALVKPVTAEPVSLFKSRAVVDINPALPNKERAPLASPSEASAPSAGLAPPVIEDEADKTTLAPLRYIGQVLATYLLCESEQGMLAIDQHAAHERLLFENLKKQFAAGKVARQALLFPKVFECSLDEVAILRRYGDEIEALGLDLEDFGDSSYVIKAVPAILGKSSPEEILAGIFARFAKEAQGQAGVRAEGVLADMACKSAIKAGRQLSAREAEALIEQMMAADIFSHCPHGRPVVKRFSEQDLKKWFYRG